MESIVKKKKVKDEINVPIALSAFRDKKIRRRRRRRRTQFIVRLIPIVRIGSRRGGGGGNKINNTETMYKHISRTRDTRNSRAI